MEKKIETKVLINKGKINISFSTLALTDDKGTHACYIPGFNLAFSTKEEAKIQVYSQAMVTSFFNYYLKKESFNALILAINKLGFKSDLHMLTMKKILNRQVSKANFKVVPDIPAGFEAATVRKNELQEMAY